MKLYESELKVMEALWKQGEATAGELARILGEQVGWNRNTTYTVIKKCVSKGAIRRSEPGFRCIPLISRQEIQQEETQELIDRMFAGSKPVFLNAFLKNTGLSQEERRQLKQMIEEWE
ncbi:MAG TPA: BlaI/MecI/CopY family transcriptional regulator [Candidatus Pullilachnospira stercoravium]|uniref:BlaI/MecI/CopY family transcriptional regulator n=1 Tax=Candidatus Pullilachnospira stercoravium TaxID=2840913 RepID=A0A9D1T5P6_9FIRM|nr:BlaI/MecI/CopY family transcriptional regulator [Candidatus Pullilachnospira stercoravium]